jgi:hypothetical protein
MAVEGHNAANRVGPEPMTRAEAEALAAAYPDTKRR